MAHLAHLTVLNPALHTRIFGKLARSQARLGHRVHIIGQGTAAQPFEKEGIAIYPVAPFGRGLGARLRGWVAIARHVRTTSADIWVLHTPELLWLGLWLKWARGNAVIYDVHEDYAANLRANGYAAAARIFRWVERLAARQLDAVCYAEACYHNMLQVADKKAFILPNAFEAPAGEPPLPAGLMAGNYWLYTGTLAAAWGVEEAISVWESTFPLHQMPLVLAGHGQNIPFIQNIEYKINTNNEIILIGGREYVPHSQIVALIRHCHVALGLYHPLPHLREKIPTKFFECVALGRPLIYPGSPVWRAWGEAHALGVAWQPGMAPGQLMDALHTWQPPSPQNDCFWEAYMPVLKAMIASVG